MLINQFAIQLYGKPLAYVDKKGYYLVSRSGNDTLLESFDGETYLYPDNLSKDNNIYYLDMPKDLSLLCRNSFGTVSEHSRYTVATQSLPVGELSESQKAIAEKYNLVDFSADFTGQQKDIAKATYHFIIEAIEKASMQKKSKTKIIQEYYRPALSAAQNKDFLELEKIKDEVLKYLGKQTRAEESRHVRKAEEKIWKNVRRRLFWLSFFIVLSVFLLIGIFASRPTANTSAVTSVEVTLEPNYIENYIQEYEKNNHVKVYPWRRKKIISTLTGSTMSEQELIDTLEYYIEKAWKN